MRYFKTKLRIIVYIFRFFNSFFYDLIRFVKYSNIEYEEFRDSDKLVSKIISLYHPIEKGLSLENPRTGFGKPRIEMLTKCISIYSSRFPKHQWNIQVESGLWVLKEYLDFNKKRGCEIPNLENFLAEYSDILTNDNPKGGTRLFKIDQSFFDENISFEDLVSLRSSIRNFGNEKINTSDVDRALKLAQASPSTCNRQSTRILRTSEREIIDELLLLQNGANGFSSGISCLLIVCSDLACYQGEGDRYSGVVDGSLFGMTLIHALTRFKIASVPLNWSKNYLHDIKLRKIINIPASYNVLFFIGLGSFKNKIKVPVSKKRNFQEICENITIRKK